MKNAKNVKEDAKERKRKRQRKKKAKRFLRFAWKAVAVQIVILNVFLFILRSGEPVPYEDTRKVIGTIESKEIKQKGPTSIGSRILYVESDSVEYCFPAVVNNAFQQYSNRAIYEAISVGDEMELRYYKDRLCFGEGNFVVECIVNGVVYRSYDGYVSDSRVGRIGFTILFSIIEIVFLAGVSVYVFMIHRKVL